MPAIELTRLRNETRRLLLLFDEPQAFVLRLHDLLEFFADRTSRAGQTGAPRPLIQAYYIPRHLLAHINRELSAQAVGSPQEALRLARALWQEPYLEFRLAAASLLGSIPPHPPEPVFTCLREWLAEQPEDRLKHAVLNEGLAAVRQQHPQALLEQIDAWLHDNRLYARKLGLTALAALLGEPGFEVVPTIFQMAQPLVLNLPRELRPDVLDLVRALARRAPAETAYLLRAALENKNSPSAAWLTRSSLEDFPPDLRQGLLAAVRAASGPNRGPNRVV